MDGRLRKETVLICADHSLSKEQVDPLGHIVLVHAVFFDRQLEDTVDKTANLGDWVLLRQVFVLIQTIAKGIDYAVNEQIYVATLSHRFLSRL